MRHLRAVEGHRTPRRSRDIPGRRSSRQRPGVRRPPCAFNVRVANDKLPSMEHGHGIVVEKADLAIIPSLRFDAGEFTKNICWLGLSSDQQIFENRTVVRHFFILGNNVVGVSANRGNALLFFPASFQLETTDPVHEIDAAFHRKLSQVETFDLSPIAFAMEGVLGSFPFTGCGAPQGEAAPKITRIVVNSDSFTIELKGGKDDGVTATITFDNTFKTLKASLRGKQIFPK